MATFPIKPTDGTTILVNNTSFRYRATSRSWIKIEQASTGGSTGQNPFDVVTTGQFTSSTASCVQLGTITQTEIFVSPNTASVNALKNPGDDFFTNTSVHKLQLSEDIQTDIFRGSNTYQNLINFGSNVSFIGSANSGQNET